MQDNNQGIENDSSLEESKMGKVAESSNTNPYSDNNTTMPNSSSDELIQINKVWKSVNSALIIAKETNLKIINSVGSDVAMSEYLAAMNKELKNLEDRSNKIKQSIDKLFDLKRSNKKSLDLALPEMFAISGRCMELHEDITNLASNYAILFTNGDENEDPAKSKPPV